MTQETLEEMLARWDYENNDVPPDESTLAARLEILTLRLLAKGQPVTAQQLADAAGVPLKITNALFEQGKARGGEWDDEGRLIGNVLTLVPTQHHFRVDGKNLYTWCSLDAVHLPGLLGRTAEVESTDPISGEPIHLTVTPDGVPEYSPDTTVLTIVLSGGDRSGPESFLCARMNFFASRENAEKWMKDYPEVSIMSVEEVYQLAREHAHAPLKSALEALD